jgi:energy-converting hydrogenase Eha subunit C
MQNFPNANQLSGRAIGSMFFAGFGTGWLFMALAAKQWISFATVSGVMLGMSILFLTAFYLLRQSRRWPRVPDDPGRGRAFGWINAIQWTAVFIVAFSFAKLHIDAYMFPLARLFRYPLHYATGAVLVAWAAASAILAPVERMQGTAALGTGIILWLSAAVTLAVAVHAARQPVPAQSVA